MTVFDVFLNDRKLCRAGVGNDGVLDAIVSWAKLTGPAAQTARRSKQPLEELRLHVGGLADDTHRQWTSRTLEAGDRVTIAIGTARSFDRPSQTRTRNPRLEEEQQRRYYLQLKEKFEGRKPLADRNRETADSATRFLNVDLDIWSASPLDSFAHAFGKKIVVLHAGKEGRGRYGAHLTLAHSGLPTDTADRLIQGFVRLIRKLPPAARASWNRARRRDFNVGIQAASRPHSYELPVQPATLQAVASVNARLVVTVYAPANR
jgi:hypothetical protein